MPKLCKHVFVPWLSCPSRPVLCHNSLLWAGSSLEQGLSCRWEQDLLLCSGWGQPARLIPANPKVWLPCCVGSL